MTFADQAQRAKTASRTLAVLTRAQKDAALASMADSLAAAADPVPVRAHEAATSAISSVAAQRA